eukprot:5228263-Pleurochrysis_carterae.AAC.1
MAAAASAQSVRQTATAVADVARGHPAQIPRCMAMRCRRAAPCWLPTRREMATSHAWVTRSELRQGRTPRAR